MSDQERNEFLYASISELQSIIQSLDTKTSFLFILLLVPLSKMEGIYETLSGLIAAQDGVLQCIILALFAFFSLCWILAFAFALRTLLVIEDPAKHVDGDTPESCFYPSHLFDISHWQALFFPRSPSTTSFRDYYSRVPAEPGDISEHLAFEQTKMMYIVSVKTKRSRLSYCFTILWIITGVLLWAMAFTNL